MKHHKSARKFGRETAERKALLRGLLLSLIEEEKINTSEAKAKEIRPLIEKLITRAKKDTLANRRIILSRLYNNNTAVKKLFESLAPKYEKRSGGYTRVIKLGVRKSDASRRAVIEFV